MAQSSQRLGLDLADAFAGHAELAADLFECVTVAVDKAKAKLQDTHLTRGQ